LLFRTAREGNVQAFFEFYHTYLHYYFGKKQGLVFQLLSAQRIRHYFISHHSWLFLHQIHVLKSRILALNPLAIYAVR
ncbi:MAG: hypothetical protein AB1780_08230, partial [Pseudomonadota bacterium]